MNSGSDISLSFPSAWLFTLVFSSLFGVSFISVCDVSITLDLIGVEHLDDALD